jgi:hypothetical protein
LMDALKKCSDTIAHGDTKGIECMLAECVNGVRQPLISI